MWGAAFKPWILRQVLQNWFPGEVLTSHLCSSCFDCLTPLVTQVTKVTDVEVQWGGGHWLAIHEFKEDFVNNQRPTALAEILLLGGVRLGLNSRGCCVSTPLETFLCPATFIHTCQLKVPKYSGLLWVKIVYCPIFTWVCFLIMICFVEQNILFGLLLAFFLDSRSSCAGNSSHMAICWKLGCNQTFCRCKRSILFFRSIALLSVSWLNYMPAHKS